jgi:hypothetical protein
MPPAPFACCARPLPAPADGRPCEASALTCLLPLAPTSPLNLAPQPRPDHHHDHDQPAGSPLVPPGRQADGGQLPPRPSAGPCTAGRAGAGAPPLPEPGPVHARSHERGQELCPAAAAGPGDDRRHRRGGARVAPPGLRGRGPGGGHGRLAAVLGGRRRCRRDAAQGRYHATCRCRPTWAPWACRVSRPGSAWSTSSTPGLARRWWSAPPAVRWAVLWASWPRPAAAGRWALPAVPTSAPMCATSSGSTPASTTRRTATFVRCRRR